MRELAAALTLALSLAVALPAAAHNVVASAWSTGAGIEGEIGFSSGELAPPGTVVRVLGPAGEALGRTTVDADGLFRFEPTEPVPHRFVADLGAGHVAAVTLALDELPVELARAAAPATEVGAEKLAAATGAALDEATLERIVATAVQRELAPLKRELAARRDEASLESIVAGLGYITGIFGLLFFVYARRRAR